MRTLQISVRLSSLPRPAGVSCSCFPDFPLALATSSQVTLCWEDPGLELPRRSNGQRSQFRERPSGEPKGQKQASAEALFWCQLLEKRSQELFSAAPKSRMGKRGFIYSI